MARGKQIDEKYLKKEYTQNGRSIKSLADELSVSTATVWNRLKKMGVLRSASEAQKKFIEENGHQRVGTQHSEDTKEKMSHSHQASWDNQPEEVIEARRESLRQAREEKWASMKPAEKAQVLEKMRVAAREKAGEGSALENGLAEFLAGEGYKVHQRSKMVLAGKHSHVDIHLPEQNIVIEVDGPTHFKEVYNDQILERNKKRDEKKNNNLLAQGFTVIRVRDSKRGVSNARFRRIFQEIEPILKNKNNKRQVHIVEG